MRIGIDLGGTKIEGLALDHHGNQRARVRRPTPRGDYAATLDALAALVDDLASSCDETCTVGVGMPGAISPATGLVKNANSTWLNGRRFREDLSARLGRDVRLANDANCFALSEATDGAAAGAPVVFGVILGTGTGGGVAVGGRIVTGANAIGGEWGHNPLPWPRDEERPGAACYCGRRGCIETWLSGPALEREFLAVTGIRRDGPAIVEAALGGDAAADAVLAAYEERLARGLASVINLLDPDVIVLGGGLSAIPRLYQRVPALWGAWVFSDHVGTRLVPPRFGDASGARGAAWLGAEPHIRGSADPQTR